jgi:hypothetical protein
VPASGWRSYLACGSLDEAPERLEVAQLPFAERLGVCGTLVRNASYLAWAAGHPGVERLAPVERWAAIAHEPLVARLTAMNTADGVAAKVWPEPVRAWFATQERDSAWRRVQAWVDAGVFEGVAAELVPYAAGVVGAGRVDAVGVLLAGGVLGEDVEAILA